MQLITDDVQARDDNRRRLIQASIDQLLRSRRGRNALDGLHQLLPAVAGLDQYNQNAILNLLEMAMGPCPMTVAGMILESLNRTDGRPHQSAGRGG